jgi:hypothetical protein
MLLLLHMKNTATNMLVKLLILIIIVTPSMLPIITAATTTAAAYYGTTATSSFTAATASVTYDCSDVVAYYYNYGYNYVCLLQLLHRGRTCGTVLLTYFPPHFGG